MMGIGAHRSLLTHSIIAGSVLETRLLVLVRIVLCTHKNLPDDHDPLWERVVRQSAGMLASAGKGASIGIAYHLMIGAMIEPGAYHGLPIHLPIEIHQSICAANAVAEASGARSYPETASVGSDAELLAAHYQHINTRIHIAKVVREYLTPAELAILTRYGAWMQALAKRVIVPITAAQLQFLDVADRLCEPSAQFERAWITLANAKMRAGWTTGSGTRR